MQFSQWPKLLKIIASCLEGLVKGHKMAEGNKTNVSKYPDKCPVVTRPCQLGKILSKAIVQLALRGKNGPKSKAKHSKSKSSLPRPSHLSSVVSYYHPGTWWNEAFVRRALQITKKAFPVKESKKLRFEVTILFYCIKGSWKSTFFFFFPTSLHLSLPSSI